MTTTGVLLNTLIGADEDNIRKGLYVSILMRDWNFAATSLTGFTPFNSSDGNLATGLLDVNNVGGAWIPLGYLSEKGPSFDPKLTTELTKVEQTRRPVRADYTEDAEEISFTLMEATPSVEFLLQNKALSDIPAIGTENFAVGRPLEMDIHYRQILALMVDNTFSTAYYRSRLYPKVVLTKMGKRQWNAKTPDSVDVSFQSFPDSFTTSPDGIAGAPVIIFEDGPAWRAQGGTTTWPTPQVAPVATAEPTHGFQLVFQQPDSLNTPFGYTVTQTTGGTSSAASVTTTTTASNGQVTITGSGLTAADSYTFTVTATGSNGNVSAPSEPSNSITAT